MQAELQNACLIRVDERSDPAEGRSATAQIRQAEIRIVDESNHELLQNHVGEIAIRSDSMLTGFYHRDDLTEKAIVGGWYLTGDLGYLDSSGELYITGRKKDLIISGGENISSIEVEGFLYKHPAVLEAAVIAAPDERWGETVCAFVQLRPGTEASEAELIQHARANLPRYCVPRTVVIGVLPTTATGKVQKYTLRERARAL